MQWDYLTANFEVERPIVGNATVDVAQLGSYLNKKGMEGWELVSVVDVNRKGGESVELIVILKRPLE